MNIRTLYAALIAICCATQLPAATLGLTTSPVGSYSGSAVALYTSPGPSGLDSAVGDFGLNVLAAAPGVYAFNLFDGSNIITGNGTQIGDTFDVFEYFFDQIHVDTTGLFTMGALLTISQPVLPGLGVTTYTLSAVVPTPLPAVPLPATLPLLVTGFGGAAMLARKRRKTR
ncbi:hypothetical protein BFP70_17395 [Thioclava sp. SK-1]|uniref:VPLPA-CTERM sorting domain-containing protein n=1 Tax=Thioclava sp. SK-1 TaxID=1889770 RepID=UPI000826BDAD|nr:VPLPA-CTERM sorting domain-containing protein [Thioclava sp. SK-1]OCX60544.1 hypothetical protein BFP70_17395 [Thioclava sp. SK-1]